MSRLTLTLAALSLALGTAAQAATPPVEGKNPTADITDDQALGCMYRLIVFSNLAGEAAKKPDISAEQRKSFDTLDDQASRGVTFYITLLYSRPWVADRKARLIRLVADIAKEPAKVSQDRDEQCLTRSLQAQADVLGAVIPSN